MTDRLPAVASRMSKPGIVRVGMRPMCALSPLSGEGCHTDPGYLFGCRRSFWRDH